MAVFRPFQAVRPLPEFAKDVAALPYDVMSSSEAREQVKGNPLSFLRVDKAEVDLPEGTGLYDETVYQKAAENLEKLVSEDICEQDGEPCVYIYRQIMNGRSQTGLVGCVSVDDYLNDAIKKHELTRADKEADRIRHVDVCNANTGPIFLTYRHNGFINGFVDDFKRANCPVYDFVKEDGVTHTVWQVADPAAVAAITRAFENVPCFYIADGHHRAASAVKVGLKRRRENPGYTGLEEFNFFLAVAFPHNELAIMDYNRLVKDLNGMTPAEFLGRVNEHFAVEETGTAGPYKPAGQHMFGMLLGDKWYKLTAKEDTYAGQGPVGRLDVTILQNYLISPILAIKDPRADKRIDFVGGIRGLEELERRVRDDDFTLAFSLFPTTLDELMSIADAGEIMPPKSTWFEPKLLSGLFVHRLK